jgi:hypothetical protein
MTDKMQCMVTDERQSNLQQADLFQYTPHKWECCQGQSQTGWQASSTNDLP